MKRIINGKSYDTETAKMICEHSYGNVMDFYHLYECLYQKKTKEFFLYGSGGAKSKYATQISNNTFSGGERITPLTEQETKEWLIAHEDEIIYENLFGKVAE